MIIEPDDSKPNPYKRTCPTCGEPACNRERRLAGWIYCPNGHEWVDEEEWRKFQEEHGSGWDPEVVARIIRRESGS